MCFLKTNLSFCWSVTQMVFHVGSKAEFQKDMTFFGSLFAVLNIRDNKFDKYMNATKAVMNIFICSNTSSCIRLK